MARQAERICELAQKAAAADDAEMALRALSELRREVDALVRVRAEHALSAGGSFANVARALGISRQAAHRRFRDLAHTPPRNPRRRLVATDAVRRVMRLAQAEALAAGATAGSEHVLLGILRTDSGVARALRFEGATPERARVSVRSGSNEATERRDSSSLPRILKQAARLALSRGDDELDIEVLLLAALADADGGARRTLAALDIQPDSLPAPHGRPTPRLSAVVDS
jgi:ATP-dependent Clp protease ATP-binding subunit ClpA